MRFAIFTHVEHAEREGLYYAYAPYVREMNLWLKHVEEVEVVSPRPPKGEKPDLQSGSSNAKAYQSSHINFTRIPSFHFLNLTGAVSAVLKIPEIIFKIFGAMRRADHLHLRCPGNVGLLACVCQIFFPSKPKSAKYAGNWDPQAKQPWTYRFQKWVLSNTFLTRNMQVLVYGDWPEQSKNVVPFFTASFSEEEKAEVPKKTFSGPFTFLFVGNLVEGKRPLEAVKLVEAVNSAAVQGTDQEIRANSIRASLEIYGDGPERKNLKTYVREDQLDQFIFFKGSRPLEELKDAYQKAHFVVLPSRSEGWPKAIAEAMFFGCIPIATPVSCVPWMLGSPPAPEGGAKKYSYAKRGVLLEERLPDTFQKSRQFECFLDSPGGEPKNVSRTGFSETPANRQARLEVTGKEGSVVPARRGGSGQWSENIKKIKELLADPERMKTMSEEAKKWSQQYTLERFEAAIKGILKGKH